jgi:hypothetical protein
MRRLLLLCWKLFIILKVFEIFSKCHVTAKTTDDQTPDVNTATISSEHELDAKYTYTAFDSASWAITSRNVSSKLDPHKQSIYDKFIRDCNDAFHPNDPVMAAETTYCEENDELRIEMNTHQPSSVYNYTSEGYKKTRVPPKLYALLRDFWDKNKDKAEPEWSSVTVYQNSWKYNTDIVHVGQERSGGSPKLNKAVYDAVKPLLEAWTGHYLDPVSLWGIRIYRNHSVLVPHVDRMPLIISAISKYGMGKCRREYDRNMSLPLPLTF